MIKQIPKISVLIICYKQEKLIKRALDSLISQKEYIYEVCVSDDHSPDQTWDVLLEYNKRYPGLFKLNRNNPNLGIMQNIEQTWKMPTGDIVYHLSGDDECGEGWFKKVVDYICENNIDYINNKICIYGDYAAVYPNGDRIIMRNNLIERDLSPISLAFRGLICNRSACYSISILHQFKKASLGRSQIAESAIDRQLQVFAEKNYYIPYLGNLYHTGIGVSSVNNLSTSVIKEREGQYDYTIRFLADLGVTVNPYDIAYLEAKTINESLKLAKNNKEVQRLKKIQRKKIKEGNNILYNFKFRKFKRVIFSIIRKMPHKSSWSISI